MPDYKYYPVLGIETDVPRMVIEFMYAVYTDDPDTTWAEGYFAGLHQGCLDSGRDNCESQMEANTLENNSNDSNRNVSNDRRAECLCRAIWSSILLGMA